VFGASAALLVTVVGLNFVGDAVRDALDARGSVEGTRADRVSGAPAALQSRAWAGRTRAFRTYRRSCRSPFARPWSSRPMPGSPISAISSARSCSSAPLRAGRRARTPTSFTTPVELRGKIANALHHWRQGRQVAEASPHATDPAPVVAPAYRGWLQAQCADIEFRGLRPRRGQSVRINHVYVPLTTTTAGDETGSGPGIRRFDREKPRLLLDLIGERSLYVSGAPGSGKSVLCRWLAWLACEGSLSGHEVEAPLEYRETLGDSLRHRLPLLVRLREFSPFLPATPGLRDLSQAELERALGAWMAAKRPPGLSWTDVEAHLGRGSALVILDGVDEVPLSQGEERQASHPRSLLLAGLAQAIPAWVMGATESC